MSRADLVDLVENHARMVRDMGSDPDSGLDPSFRFRLLRMALPVLRHWSLKVDGGEEISGLRVGAVS
jgi:hypothetical protein